MTQPESPSLPARVRAWLAHPLGMPRERAAFVLCAVLALGGLAAGAYHFFFVQYGNFALQQVAPKWPSPWLQRVLGSAAKTNAEGLPAVDHWPLNSPTSRPWHSELGQRMNGAASDWLGVWHYTKMMLEGQYPYSVNGYFTYNLPLRRFPVVQDPKVPEQLVGGLSYLPFAPVLLLPFYRDSYFASLLSYYGFLALFVLAAIALAARRNKGFRTETALLLLVAAATSYPLLLLLDRGNLEGLLWVLVALSSWAWLRDRPYVAAALLGPAVATKPHIAALFGCFLVARQWKPLAAAVGSTLAATAIGVLSFHAPVGEVLRGAAAHVGKLAEQFSASFFTRNNHSLLSWLRAVLPVEAGPLAKVYPFILLATGLACLGWLWWKRASKAQALSVLLLLVVLLPPVSFDYTLVHLYVPFVLFVSALFDRGRPLRRVDWALLLLLAATFLPKEYGVGLLGDQVGCGHAINGTALVLALGLLLAFDPFPGAAPAAAPAPAPADAQGESAPAGKKRRRG